MSPPVRLRVFLAAGAGLAALLLWAYASMRRAEAAADSLRRK